MTNLFRVVQGDLVPIARTKLASEDQIEGWIATNPRRIGLDVLIIGRQVITAFGGRIDLLGLERDGTLTIIELKRDRTPREIVAQILDYGSWVRRLTSRDVNEISVAYRKKPLDIEFQEWFGDPLPDSLNTSHAMVIVASEFDESSRRIVEYLVDEHGISINTAFFNVFDHDGEILLATDWLIDQDQVKETTMTKKSSPWTGWFYVNVGDAVGFRSWEDMRTYGFLAAGHDLKYSGPLKKLKPSDPVFAYQRQRGYVGYGIVTSEAVPASKFHVEGKPLSELTLQEPGLLHDAGNAEAEDWAVGVAWKRTYGLSEAKTFEGAFANQNIVCRLTDPATIEYLQHEFVLSEPSVEPTTNQS